MIPDYSKYSEIELEQAYQTIDKNAYPDIYEALDSEIKNRQLEIQQEFNEELVTNSNPFANNVSDLGENQTRKFLKFGGVLLFFKVSIFIGLTINTVLLAIAILAIINNTFETKMTLVVILIATSALILIPILFELNKRNEQTPKTIIKRLDLLAVIGVISIISFAISMDVSVLDVLKEEWRSFGYPLIWRNYFQNSKRVKVYYQKPERPSL